MSNKKSNLVERRLYEYTLHAVCSPLNVSESGATIDQLAAHVAHLFNVSAEEHEEKYMRALKTQPCSVVLFVHVKKARNLLGEDQNGLSDPYCKVSVVYTPSNSDDPNGAASSSSSLSPPSSPNRIKRTASFFSCVSSTSDRLEPPAISCSRRSSKSSRSSSRKRSVGGSSTASSDRSRTSSTVSYRTDIRPKTINPEWNQHFDFEIENVLRQHLLITVFDSDNSIEPKMTAVAQEKRGVSQKIRGFRTFLKTGHIDDDFLGQIKLDIKSIATFDRERWYPLVGLKPNRSNNSKSRGEILLGLKVHFKLDDKTSKHRQHVLKNNVVEFRRRHSTLSTVSQAHSSIILRSTLFRKNFRPSSLQASDYSRTSIFEEDHQSSLGQNDSCLTPATETDLPLLIEEYHQLFRIVILHALEDAREAKKDQAEELVIDWNGALSELSHSVLIQFRVLYNIPVLSESFIQLLVIMELRCSEEYFLFISQRVIEAYLRPFMDKIRQKTDDDGLDFTDYEKTVFKEIFYLFIDHYKHRLYFDASWFLPSKENLPNTQSIFATICTLLNLKICSNDTAMKNHLEQTIKTRLRTDIEDSFALQSFVFNDKHDIQLNIVRNFVDYVKKIAESMTLIKDYNKIFALFNIDYMKICFFEEGSAADRLAELIKCLLTNMIDCFETYSKPIVKATASIYDPNLIQSSDALLHLYIYVQTIVTSIKPIIGERDWIVNAFKMKLIEYRTWFLPTMHFLLEGFVADIRQFMERALEDDNEAVIDEDIVRYSRSSMAATSLCIERCTIWEGVDYPDADLRYTALIKLTNTICEQCQHYARRTVRKLSENLYFTDLNRTRSFNVTKKLCMLVNDIEYVKRSILSKLPELLHFSIVIDNMIAKYESTDFQKTKVTLERLISTAEQEMTDVIKLIFEHVAALVHVSLQGKISNYYKDEKLGKVNCMEGVNHYIDQEILHHLYKGLEPVQYSRVACAIRIKALQCLRELLPAQERSDFYERVLTSFEQLAGYFERVCREDPNFPGPPCDEVLTFRRTLRERALTTEQLQLAYYREICQIHSPLESPKTNGEIVYRTAYEIVNSLLTISVFILCCRNLPRMDLIGTSDPYVVLELLPVSLYQKRPKEYKTVVQNRTLNPEYNEAFQWHRLPINVLDVPGAVLRLSVWDKDYVTDDFIGECLIPLKSIESSRNLHSLRDVPVSEVRLRRPHRSLQPPTYDLIRNRGLFDDQAALFLKQRTAVMQSGKNSDGGSVISDDRNSSGSYASTALRSLICMLPFNIGFGFDSNVPSRSEAADDEEII